MLQSLFDSRVQQFHFTLKRNGKLVIDVYTIPKYGKDTIENICTMVSQNRPAFIVNVKEKYYAMLQNATDPCYMVQDVVHHVDNGCKIELVISLASHTEARNHQATQKS